MKNIKFRELAILIIPLVICTVAYFLLPDQIPRQFHADGTATYMAKEFIFIFAFVPYIIYWRYKKRT
ncbi:MAG: DUF1648 domain-containing protein [Thermoclostridium sp.]|nr:DUF1648 domain-containing protein [Thermoclostridium sp.]